MTNPENLQRMLQKALVATLAGLLALMLLSALLIGGFALLIQAMTLGLTPWVGAAAAYGMTGFSCFLLLGLIFKKLMPKPRPQAQSAAEATGQGTPQTTGTQGTSDAGAPLDNFRQIIREHPWDSIAASFALGYAQSRDPRLKEMLLESGFAYMRAAKAGSGVSPGPSRADTGPDTAETSHDPGKPASEKAPSSRD